MSRLSKSLKDLTYLLEGYGNVDPLAFQEILKSQLPEEIDPQVDMVLQAGSPEGRKQLFILQKLMMTELLLT